MPSIRGRYLPWTVGRRFVADILHFSRPSVQAAVERMIRVPEVAAARAVADPKPGWHPVLLKGFALATKTVPDLRCSLLSVPWPRLYQHANSVAAVTAERQLPDGPAVLVFDVPQPETTPLAAIEERFRAARTAPVEEIKAFRRQLRMSRLPLPVRRLGWWLALRVAPRWREKYFGTFVTSSTVPAGATPLQVLSPLTSFFSFGPVGDDGSVLLRLAFDHRVLDGGAAARGLVETERALRTEVLAELRSLARPLRAAV